MSDPYFATPTGAPTEAGRFVDVAELPVIEVTPGLELRPLLGADVMVSFARYLPNATAPLHAHVEEQIFVALEGGFEVELDGDVRTLHPGQAALIPSWVPHRVTAGPEGGYQIDVFNPPRQGLLDQLAALGQ